MDFEEFLWPLDHETLTKEISQCYKENKKIFVSVHDKLMTYYKDYLYVGGMPDSVLSYLQAKEDLNYYSREIKRDLLEDYLAI